MSHNLIVKRLRVLTTAVANTGLNETIHVVTYIKHHHTKTQRFNILTSPYLQANFGYKIFYL